MVVMRLMHRHQVPVGISRATERIQIAGMVHMIWFVLIARAHQAVVRIVVVAVVVVIVLHMN